MYFKDTRKSENEISGIVEVEVVMLNINHKHNKELLEKCTPLYEYSFFVARIRFYVNKFEKEGKEYTLEDIVELAISDLPKNFKILEFLLIHKAEVKGMCLFEYDEERHMRGEREEGRAEGLAQGREEGRAQERIKMLIELVNEGTYTVEQASKKANMTVKEFKKILADDAASQA